MTYYTRILPWENNKRLDKLAEFRGLVIEYFNNSRAEWMVDERIEQPKAEEARVKINRMMDGIHDIILYARVNPSIRYTPPPAVGGYIQNIDLVQNIFNLHLFHIALTTFLTSLTVLLGFMKTMRALLSSEPLIHSSISVSFLIWSPVSPLCSLGARASTAKKLRSRLLVD